MVITWLLLYRSGRKRAWILGRRKAHRSWSLGRLMQRSLLEWTSWDNVKPKKQQKIGVHDETYMKMSNIPPQPPHTPTTISPIHLDMHSWFTQCSEPWNFDSVIRSAIRMQFVCVLCIQCWTKWQPKERWVSSGCLWPSCQEHGTFSTETPVVVSCAAINNSGKFPAW